MGRLQQTARAAIGDDTARGGSNFIGRPSRRNNAAEETAWPTPVLCRASSGGAARQSVNNWRQEAIFASAPEACGVICMGTARGTPRFERQGPLPLPGGGELRSRAGPRLMSL